MEFRKYASIDNTNRAKTINYFIQSGYTQSDIEWVATLKVHGANFSYWTDGKEVKVGKRSGFLGNGAFYNYDRLPYKDEMLDIIKDLGASTLTIYGEIFGGFYPHPDVKKIPVVSKVQSGVYYNPDVDFIAFDWVVDGKLLSWDEVKRLCRKYDIPHVPELGRGTFEEVMNISPVFPDPLYRQYGLPPIENNEAEGLVLKPVNPIFMNCGSRVILKNKNPKFAEKKGKKKEKKQHKLSEKAQAVYDEITQYLTENRLRNVISHGELEEITNKSFGPLLGLFVVDALDDFKKDNPDMLESLEKKEQGLVTKMVNAYAAGVIRPNFVNIIDGEF
jgi:Rnl2 family RNA ligase